MKQVFPRKATGMFTLKKTFYDSSLVSFKDKYRSIQSQT